MEPSAMIQFSFDEDGQLYVEMPKKLYEAIKASNVESEKGVVRLNLGAVRFEKGFRFTTATVFPIIEDPPCKET